VTGIFADHGCHNVIICLGFADATVVFRGEAVAGGASLTPRKLMTVLSRADLDIDPTVQTVNFTVHAIEVAFLGEGKVLPVVVEMLVPLPNLLHLHALRLVVLKVVRYHVETRHLQVFVLLASTIHVDVSAVKYWLVARASCRFGLILSND